MRDGPSPPGQRGSGVLVAHPVDEALERQHAVMGAAHHMLGRATEPHDPLRPMGRLTEDAKGRRLVVKVDEPYV